MTSNRKVYIMRHGERVDFIFPDWVDCFDKHGNYVRKDLNMPKALPKRTNTIQGWDGDTPLTNIGLHQARLTGEAFLAANVSIDHVYCSAAFRCIQTAAAVLEGLQLQDKLKLKIEPALFEWLHFYTQTNAAHFLTQKELIAANYNIDEEYKTMLTHAQLQEHDKESVEQFYARNHEFITKILEQTTGNILLVGHSMSLDSCSRQLIGAATRGVVELLQLVQQVPFCGIAAMEQTAASSWQLVAPACLPLTFARNKHFDWHILLANEWPTPDTSSGTDFPPKIREWAEKNPHIVAKLKRSTTTK